VVLTVLVSSSAAAFCRMSTLASSATTSSSCTLCEDDDPSADCRYLEWRRRCMEVAIDAPGASDFTEDELRGIVERSIGAWLAVECPYGSPGFDVRLMGPMSRVGGAEYNTEAGNVNALVWVQDWRARDYDPRAYALTTVWHSVRTGEIYDADMEINEELGAGRGPYTICPARTGCEDDRIDLQNVMTHEFGHFFGLGHSLETFATMHAVSPPGEVQKRIIRTDDIAGFCTIYPQPLPAECDYTPRGGLSLEGGGGGGGCCAVAGGAPLRPGGALVGVLVTLVVLGRRRRR
jgi:hypothetical protein